MEIFQYNHACMTNYIINNIFVSCILFPIPVLMCALNWTSIKIKENMLLCSSSGSFPIVNKYIIGDCNLITSLEHNVM